jgi:hypothetical protein
VPDKPHFDRFQNACLPPEKSDNAMGLHFSNNHQHKDPAGWLPIPIDLFQTMRTGNGFEMKFFKPCAPARRLI